MSVQDTLDRADALRREKQFDEAAALLLETIGTAPEQDRAVLYNRLGNVHVAARDLDASESAYKQSLTFNPAHGDAMNNLAVVYKRQGLKKLFVETHRKSMWLSVKNPRRLLGNCRERGAERTARRWVFFLGFGLGAMILLRWLFSRWQERPSP